MENQQPAGETQINQKKSWYKKWWVIAIGVLILYSIGSSSLDDAKKKADEAKKIQEQPTQQTPQLSKAVFDVPSLIGKNIDEIKNVLGKPSIDEEPTKQWLESGLADDWSKEYQKDGESLLITYYPKTKVVVDFFIAGADKKALLGIGKLNESDSNYIVEFVKAYNGLANLDNHIRWM